MKEEQELPNSSDYRTILSNLSHSLGKYESNDSELENVNLQTVKNINIRNMKIFVVCLPFMKANLSSHWGKKNDTKFVISSSLLLRLTTV